MTGIYYIRVNTQITMSNNIEFELNVAFLNKYSLEKQS